MGHVQDRWHKTVTDPNTRKTVRVKTELYGKGMRYKVRHLDPDGKEVSRSFPDRAKRQADEFLHKIENQKREGGYLDPHGTKIKFRDYAEQWLSGQSFKSTTRVNVPSRLKNQAYPFLGNIELGAITPTTKLPARVLRPCASDSGSQRHQAHSRTAQDRAVDRRPTQGCMARAPPIVQVTMPLGAGAGLRQGEMFGLSPHDIDREANIIRNRLSNEPESRTPHVRMAHTRCATTTPQHCWKVA